MSNAVTWTGNWSSMKNEPTLVTGVEKVRINVPPMFGAGPFGPRLFRPETVGTWFTMVVT